MDGGAQLDRAIERALSWIWIGLGVVLLSISGVVVSVMIVLKGVCQ